MTIAAMTLAASTPVYSPATGTVSTSSAATSTASTTAASTTAASTSAMNPVTSAALSEQAGIVATLGVSGSTVQTYGATGLLTRIEQAADGAAALPASPLAAAGTGATAASATSSASSVLDADSNWATALKSNPALAGVAIGDAFDQGILNTIDTYA